MIHTGQVGAIIRLTSTKNLSTAVTLAIRYRKPDGVTGSWVGTISGTTGVQYTTTAAADLNVAGTWSFQGYATYSGGVTDFTSQVLGVVGEVIQPPPAP